MKKDDKKNGASGSSSLDTDIEDLKRRKESTHKELTIGATITGTLVIVGLINRDFLQTVLGDDKPWYPTLLISLAGTYMVVFVLAGYLRLRSIATKLEEKQELIQIRARLSTALPSLAQSETTPPLRPRKVV
jgi:hypothetical protein